MDYSEWLFHKLHNKLRELFHSQTKMKWEGLWTFSFVKGADLLKHSYLEFKNDNEVNKDELKETTIHLGHGSLGYSFAKLQKDETRIIDDEVSSPTFNDPRGVVCDFDSTIGQEHAVFAIIRQENEELGMLDIFFSGTRNKEDLKKFCETLSNELNSDDSELKQLCASAFKIKTFDDFLDIQKDQKADVSSNDLEGKIQLAIAKIERYISLTAVTPLFYLTDEEGNTSPNLIGLNFEFIQKLIEYEYRFCALISQDNSYNTCKSSVLSCTCHNNFLQKYFIEVIRQLESETKSHEFYFNDSTYRIEILYFAKIDLDLDELIKEIIKDNDNKEKIKARLIGFSGKYKEANKLSQLKLQDELWFSHFNDKLSKIVNVIILYRKNDKYLKSCLPDCRDRSKASVMGVVSITQLISPSNLLHLLYRDKPTDKNPLERYFEIYDGQNFNIVGFKILDKQKFSIKLKRLIANNTTGYSKILSTYINGEELNVIKNINGINLNYTGINPLKDNNYKPLVNEQINLIGGLLQTKKTLAVARKAAIAQVMLRNMSHNLGSHVLANLTQPQTVLKMAYLNKHENLSKEEEEITKTGKLTYKNIDNDEIKINSNPESFDVAMAELSGYMRTRMDFLADISTGTAVIETTQKLSDYVIKPLSKRAILLKKYITGNNKKVKITNLSKELMVAFPNDNLGVQALYIIIENVIRNSAKHGKGESVIITFEYNTEMDSNLTELIIYDKNDAKTPEELEKLVDEQNARISKDMLREDGSLRHGSWGMLEMKIASAYLRKIPVEEIDEILSPCLLTAIPVSERGKKYLGYKFYVLKPKHVLVVLNYTQIQLSDEYIRHGIRLVTLDKLKSSYESFSHEVVLFVDCSENEIHKIGKRISTRVIVATSTVFNEKISSPPQDFIKWTWEKWFDRLIKKTNAIKVVREDDSENGKPDQVELSNDRCQSSTKAVFVCHFKNFRENVSYFEPYGSLHPAKEQIGQVSSNCSMELKSRFLETINYTAAIIDERIQRYSNEKFDGGIENHNKRHIDFLLKCGIEVPPLTIDLNAESFQKVVEANGTKETIKQYLKEWIEEKVRTCNFLVIHIGIIERMLELEKLKDEEKQKRIEEFLLSWKNIKKRKAKFVITSGRGHPESLPQGERFVHYSNIAQYVIERRSKYHLIQLLMSARETK